MPSGDNFNLPALNFTQFLSPYFGLTIGEYTTVTSNSGDMNEFAHGKGDTQFMNMALNFNPVYCDRTLLHLGHRGDRAANEGSKPGHCKFFSDVIDRQSQHQRLR